MDRCRKFAIREGVRIEVPLTAVFYFTKVKLW